MSLAARDAALPIAVPGDRRSTGAALRNANAVLTIAYRDVLKLLRDPARIISTFVFPFVFIALLGGSLQASFGAVAGYDFLTYTFTGVLAQTLFQSAASGIISLIEDRENDFSQEIFVAPISRYTIVGGKILGESLVAMTQGVAIVVFGLVVGVPLSLPLVIALVPTLLAVCLVGASFGVLVLANIGSQRAANQVFPFIVLPQYFLAGVFNPIQSLPPVLDVASHLAPMRYVVDFARGVFYAGRPEAPKVVLESPLYNLAVMTAMFVLFLVVGTFLFVRRERNR